MKKLGIALALSSLVSVAHGWELSDVSILLPLPAKMADANQLLSVSTAGTKGVLVPKTVTARLPKLVTTADREQMLNQTRAIGVRLDPCFFEGHGPTVCHRQIRMVWQPLVLFKGKVSTKDATLHSFYEFDAAEWADIVSEYQTLLAANPVNASANLQVNPRLKAQGYAGPFWKGLRALLLKHCGEKSLVRTTIMTLEPGENDWRFLGFNVRKDGSLKPILISNVNLPEQRVKSIPTPGNEMKSAIEPELASISATAIFGDSAKAVKTLADHELREFADDLRIVEDPSRSNPGTIDCATCHLSGPAGRWARGQFPEWDWSFAANGSNGSRDVRNVTIVNQQPRRLRGFGYFYADPLFSQRLVNETAIVAEAFERTNPGK